MNRHLTRWGPILLWIAGGFWLTRFPALLDPSSKSVAGFAISASGLAIVMGLLFFLPGLALLHLLALPRITLLERLALAPAMSLPLYPLLFLCGFLFGFHLNSRVLWGLLGLVGFTLALRPRHPSHEPHQGVKKVLVVAFVIFALLWGTRFWVTRDIPAPMWGDGVQHTVIVQRMLEEGGLFSSWQPYAPAQTFTYHFGFHAATTAFAWLSQQPAHLSVLLTAQMLNVAAVLVIAAPVLAFTRGNAWSALTAVVVAGFLSRHPAFYVNWSRNTQLAGQVILPALIWLFHHWWFQKERPPRAILAMAAWLAAGLLLTHYRIALLAALAGIAWAGVALWYWRATPKEWLKRTVALSLAGLLGAFCTSPWFWHLRQSRFDEYAGRTFQAIQNEQRTRLVQQMRAVWQMVPAFYPRWLWGGSIVLGGVALLRSQPWAFAVTLWAVLAFLATNLYLVGAGGNDLISNFTLMIALYLPLALIIGAAVSLLPERFFASRAKYLLALALVVPLGTSIPKQVHIVDESHQLLGHDDLTAFAWIRSHTPDESLFLINGFLAFNESVAVGSDGGWWLSYFTKRAILIPPLISSMEKNPPGWRPSEIRDVVREIAASQGDPEALRSALCRAGITHVYLGAKRGMVGGTGVPLLHEEWLHASQDFTLLFQAGQSQVWAFDRSRCQEASVIYLTYG